MNFIWSENEEIKFLQEYLKIPSVHPDIDYEPCAKFLETQAKTLDLPLNIYYPAHPKKPVVIITWIGTEPQLPTILLNSHMDVVPVYEEYWTYPPFSAFIDDEGRIYARGTQDMKSIGMQYLAVIRALKNDGIQLKRTVHVVFVPDEEISSGDGMVKFVQTDDFKKLNVGFALDEACPSTTDDFVVYYAERSLFQINLKISGTPGHGSLLLENTVGDKLRKILNKIMDFRDGEVKKLKDNKNLSVADVTTINLTQIHGGVQMNVIPPELTFGLDIRLAIDVNHDEFENQIRNWCKEAGGGIEMSFEERDPYVPPTSIDDSNPYWVAFKNVFEELNLKITPSVCPGATDARCLRQLGIPAIGFSPINNTPLLIHDHNEYIRADTYLKGIEIYKKIILNLGNL